MDMQLKDWPAWFLRSPVVNKIIREAQAETAALRKAAKAEINRLQKEFKAAFPALQKKIDDAISELRQLEKQRQELLLKIDAAYSTKSNEVRDFDRAVLLQEKALLDTCDPAILEAIKFFSDKVEEVRRPSAIRKSVYAEGNMYNSKKEIYRSSNYTSITEAISYMRAAIDELEAMKLVPECDHLRIEGLKKGIPSTQEFKESKTFDHFFGE
jgi:hypothetical protein